jgi:hypothetical protein
VLQSVIVQFFVPFLPFHSIKVRTSAVDVQAGRRSRVVVRGVPVDGGVGWAPGLGFGRRASFVGTCALMVVLDGAC